MDKTIEQRIEILREKFGSLLSLPESRKGFYECLEILEKIGNEQYKEKFLEMMEEFINIRDI